MPRRTQTVWLYSDEDLHEITRLRDVAARAMLATEPARIGDGESAAQEAARAHDAYVEEAQGRATAVTVQSLPHKQWRQLIADHPARKIVDPESGEDQPHPDDSRGFNSETLPDDLVALCVVEPHSDSDVARAEFLEELTPVDFERVARAAYSVNTETFDPKADLSSTVERISGETSTSPARLG